jgi:hypothetical protein
MPEPLDYSDKPLEKNRYGRSGRWVVIILLTGAIGLALAAVVFRLTRPTYTGGTGVKVETLTTQSVEE